MTSQREKFYQFYSTFPF